MGALSGELRIVNDSNKDGINAKDREHRPEKNLEYVFICLDKKECQKENYGKKFLYRNKFMKSLCNKAGVKHFGFHAIRHLTASILFNLGYEVAAIQTILRHKSPSTTERYLKSFGLERAREALESLSKKDCDTEDMTAEVLAFNKTFGANEN